VYSERHGGFVNNASIQGTILSFVDVLMFKSDSFRVSLQLSNCNFWLQHYPYSVDHAIQSLYLYCTVYWSSACATEECREQKIDRQVRGCVCQLYEELFEIPFFECSTEFYKEEAQRLREESDCCTFMWRVRLQFLSSILGYIACTA